MKSFALVIFIAAALLAACEGPPATKDIDRNTMDHSKMGHAKHSEMQSSPGVASAPYELQFIDTMIAHHQGAIDMALLADTRAQHPELKTLAEKIIADQQKEIATMKAWREKYFAGAAPAINMDLPGMRDGMKGMDVAKLDALKGNDFDLEFIRQMIPHHEGAVAMARDSVAKAPADKAKQTELTEMFRTFSQTIVDEQTAEIGQMQKWLEEWGK